MDRICLFALLGASAALTAGPLPFAAATPESDADKVIANNLAVQTAMLQGKDHLRQADAKKAVEVLEAQLPRIDGNRIYLATLRDAYRAYVTDLYFAKQDALAKKYLERLRILDPRAAEEMSVSAAPRPAAPPQTAQTNPARPPQYFTPPSRDASASAPGKAKIRLRSEDDDPFGPAHQLPPRPGEGGKQQAARELVARAETEFGRKRFGEARLLYEQAYQADRSVAEVSRDRWAYCKLNHVVEELNRPNVRSDVLPELEREVQGALVLAPKLADTGNWLLREIQQRRPASAGAADLRVQHAEAGGWHVAETANFRILHKQSQELAEKAARVAERTRLEMSRKWFGNDGEAWQPRCDVYLHATAADYTRETGVPGNSPGHSRIESDPSGHRIVGRRIDLHCDNPSMLEAVLPHEATHVVLAGQFGNKQVPRWVDEGIAVLTEPAEKVNQHRQNLARFGQERGLFSVRELMQLHDYPQGGRIGAFYAQSVSLVDFLSKQRGPQAFCQFVRDGLQDGYEPALQKHYNIQSFGDLEARWGRQELAGLSVAER